MRIIITGGPGFGKTAVIKEISNQGFPVHPEAGRSIIKHQLETGGDILPWKDLMSFSNLVFEERLKQYHNYESDTILFFDRGLPDVVAYLIKDKLNVPEDFMAAIEKHRYHQKVFVAPPWQEIYTLDNERKEPFSEALIIHKHITDLYTKIGYELIDLPFADIKSRVNFILNSVN